MTFHHLSNCSKRLKLDDLEMILSYSFDGRPFFLDGARKQQACRCYRIPKSASLAGSKTSSKRPNSLSVRHGETSGSCCALTVRSMSLAVSFLTKLCAQHNLKRIKKTPF